MLILALPFVYKKGGEILAFTSTNYDGKTALQLQIEISETDFASDGSSSTVIANYYLISVNQPVGRFTGNIGSDYGTTQTIACSLGSKSQTFTTNAFAIANAVNKFGDKYYIGSLSATVSRSSTGNANIRATASTTLVWISGYPSRSVTGVYSCIDSIHTVTYNANGGSNAPASQNKCYGTVLTLRNEIPVKTGYKFMGWSTSSNGSVEYSSGGSFGTDADTTLYAVWKLIDINIKLTASTIRIPCAFIKGKYGFEYFHSDPNYYIEIPYSYSFSGNVSSLKAKPFYVDDENGITANPSANAESEQSLYGTSSVVRVSMATIGKSIINYKNSDKVKIGILFSFNVDGTDATSVETVECPLEDFSFFTVQESSAYLSPNADNLMYFKLLVTYPQSYNPNVQLANAYPLFMYNNEDAMLSVSKQNISDNSMLITCSVSTDNLKNGLVDINYLDSVLLYSENPSFNKGITVRYPQAINKIIIKETGECQSFEFIETDQVAGFLKGGYVCAKEFVEDSDTIEIKADNFNFKTLTEI